MHLSQGRLPNNTGFLNSSSRLIQQNNSSSRNKSNSSIQTQVGSKLVWKDTALTAEFINTINKSFSK